MRGSPGIGAADDRIAPGTDLWQHGRADGADGQQRSMQMAPEDRH